LPPATEDKHDWARLRLAQARAASALQPGGLAILLDCGEFDNIHPTDKRTPGERLCDVALRVVYGMDAPELPPRAGEVYAGSYARCHAERTCAAPGDGRTAAGDCRG